jgi:hypothetical protein
MAHPSSPPTPQRVLQLRTWCWTPDSSPFFNTAISACRFISRLFHCCASWRLCTPSFRLRPHRTLHISSEFHLPFVNRFILNHFIDFPGGAKNQRFGLDLTEAGSGPQALADNWRDPYSIRRLISVISFFRSFLEKFCVAI